MSNNRVLALACSTTMIAQLGVTLYLPAMPDIAQALSMSEAQGYKSLLIYLVGAAAPLIFAINVIRVFGRSIALLGFCAVFFGASILSLWVQDDTGFYLCRLLQGFGGGGAALIGRALLSEIYSGARLAKSLALLSYSFVFALVVGQVVGGYLVSFIHWEAIAVVMALGSMITVILVLPVMSELAALDADCRLGVDRSRYVYLLRQPRFYLPVIIGGCSYGVFVVCQGVGVYVFDVLLGWGSTEYGLLGIGLGLAYFLGALSVRIVLKSISVYALSLVGVSIMVAAAMLSLLAMLSYLDRYFVVVAYFAVWYAQAMIYPCVASMAVRECSGIAPMMLFGFLQQLVALFFGALASLVIPIGLHAVGFLTFILGGFGVVVSIRLLAERN